MNTKQQPKLNIDLSSTTPITSDDGNMIFAEGVILRKVSRFILGSSDDGTLPVPVMYDIKTGKILLDMVPKELREELQKYNDSLNGK